MYSKVSTETSQFCWLVNLTCATSPNGASCPVEVSGFPLPRFLGPPQAHFLSPQEQVKASKQNPIL